MEIRNNKMKYQTSLAQFLWHIGKGRWMVVVVSFYILSFSGATYIFGIYSGAIKSTLNYNQETVNTLSFFKDLGSNVGILSGLMNEISPTWMVLALGATMNLFGYLMVWMAITHKISPPSPSLMYFYLCIGANSQTFANTGVLVTCVKNFPQSRGIVLGLVKGCVGLSGAIFTQIYHAVYGQDTKGIVLLIAILPSIVTILFMFLIRPMQPILDKRQDKHFFTFLYLALVLASFLMVVIIVENVFPLASIFYKAIGGVTLLLVAANVLVAIQVEREKHTSSLIIQGNEQNELVIQSVSSNGTLRVLELEVPPNELHKEDIIKKGPKRHSFCDGITNNENTFISKVRFYFTNWPQRGEDFTIPQAILSLDMWILFLSITCGVGATLTAIDNMGQIGASLGYSTISISTCVSLISIWNFLGRVIAGFSSEYLLQKYRFPRTLMLTIVLALSCVGHIMIAFPGRGTLYVASVVIGLCFGAQWPLLFAVISELFGLKYYATLYNVGAIASPLGSYLLNVKVAGYLYDKEARRQASVLSPNLTLVTKDLVCNGSQCFRMTFLIMTMVSGVGSLVSALLVIRTRKFYAQDIYAKFNMQTNKTQPRHFTPTTTNHA